MKKIFLGILLPLIAAALGYYFFWGKNEAEVRYRTVKVERGALSSYVNANGTVNPVITVLVGSQVSGTIQKLYADYNSAVKAGQLIAQIDPALFQAQVSQAQAKVENYRAAQLTAQADIATARANVESSKANVIRARVAVEDAKRNLDRSLELFRRNLISASDRDNAQTNYDLARAQLEAAQAQQKASEAQLESAQSRLEAARAQTKQAEAELELAQVNLNHTKILAPVTGIVISRNVDVGQTVAASLQAPTLFTIAQDLTEMQVDTNVSEADVGRVAVGQDATFTVDAFPLMTFAGKVAEIRNAPQTIQNVVTYAVIVKVKNPDLKLRPGMTANVSILVAHKENVLKIPNAALRFRPDFVKRETTATPSRAPAPPPSSPSPPNLENFKAQLRLTPEQEASLSRILKETRKESLEGARVDLKGLPEATRMKIRSLLTDAQRKQFDLMILGRGSVQMPTPVYRVWTPAPQGGRPLPVEITTGISDGSFTEVVSGALREGQEVIIEALGGSSKGTPPPQPSMRGLR